METIKLAGHPLITTGAAAIFNTAKELQGLLAKTNSCNDFANKMASGQKKFLESYCSINELPASDRLIKLIDNQLSN
jgi:hypothetical protein